MSKSLSCVNAIASPRVIPTTQFVSRQLKLQAGAVPPPEAHASPPTPRQPVISHSEFIQQAVRTLVLDFQGVLSNDLPADCVAGRSKWLVVETAPLQRHYLQA